MVAAFSLGPSWSAPVGQNVDLWISVIFMERYVHEPFAHHAPSDRVWQLRV